MPYANAFKNTNRFGLVYATNTMVEIKMIINFKIVEENIFYLTLMEEDLFFSYCTDF